MATKQWKVEHRELSRKYQRMWYSRNRNKQKDIVASRRTELNKWFQELKSTLKCECCPENHPSTLDFHHVDRNKKDMAIGLTINGGWSKKRILKEISKCIVLCANCHRKLHWNEKHAGVSSPPSKRYET